MCLLPPVTSRSHLNICLSTANELLQTPHNVWIALHFSVVGRGNCCFRGNVGDTIKLGAVVDILILSDGVVVETILDIIKKDRTTALPLRLSRLDGRALHRILLEAICDGVTLVIVEDYLAAASADITIKTTYTRVYLIGRDLTNRHCQIDTVPTPNAVLIYSSPKQFCP